MSWLMAISIGAVCGVAGAALTMRAADSIIRLFKVSTFEGAAGYLVVFLLVPLGFLVGMITGIVITRLHSPAGAPAIVMSTGLAILVTAGLLTAGYATAYVVRERPFEAIGQPLTLQMEIRYRSVPGEDPRDELIRASLFASDKDNSFVDVDPRRVEERDGWLVIGCETPLRTRSVTRIFSLAREGEPYQVFQMPLAAIPNTADSAWSDWVSSRAPLGQSEQGLDPARSCELRYRVLFHE